jgi:hypothetical protein
MSSELELLRQRISELEAEKMELRRGLEKTIADSSIEISKLNAIIMELEKNKAVITKLKSENTELRDRVTKVEQRQLQNDNVTKITNSSNNVHLTSIRLQSSYLWKCTAKNHWKICYRQLGIRK